MIKSTFFAPKILKSTFFEAESLLFFTPEIYKSTFFSKIYFYFFCLKGVWQGCFMHKIRRQKDVLKNLQNDEFIQIWREILIGLLVSDDVIPNWQEMF